jgi:uncharacterized membrane protein
MDYLIFNRKKLSWTVLIIGWIIWALIYVGLILPNLPSISDDSTGAYLETLFANFGGVALLLIVVFVILLFVKWKDDRWWQ